MAAPHVDFDRAIPDRTVTDGLAPTAAAEIDFLAGRTARWLEEDSRVHPGVRARALVVAGRTPEAITLLEGLATSKWSPQGLAAATWSASRVSATALLDSLEAGIATVAEEATGEFWIQDGTPLCTESALRGLLAVATGDLEQAVSHLEDAVAQGDRRAPMWGALARMELARVQLTMALAVTGVGSATSEGTHGAVSRHAAACRNLGVARTFFASGGYEHLSALAAELMQLTGSPTAECSEDDRCPPPEFCGGGHQHGPAEPTLGVLAPEVFSSESLWTVGFGVQPPRDVATRKGLVALRHLIANRDRQVPAVEIAAVLEGTSNEADPTWIPTNPVLPEVLAELDRLRCNELADPSELSAALRQLVYDNRERSRVTKLLRRTISGLADDHRSLAAHLDHHVRTGYLCCYSAPPQVRWIL